MQTVVWLVLGSPSAGHCGWLAEECMLRVRCDGVCCAVVWLRGVAAKMGSFVAAENGGGVLGCLLGRSAGSGTPAHS